MHHKVDRLLLHLEARVEAFAMCEVAEGWRLDLGPMPTTLLHYVIGGSGWLAGYSEPLAPGALIVVPAGVGHQLQAPGRLLKVHEGMSEFRAFTEGLLRISAGNRADLRTACATVTTRYLYYLDLFSGIDKPLVFDLNAAGRSPAVVNNLVAELKEPRFGSRAIASALLKQMLVLLLRAQLDGDGTHPDWIVSLGDPRIARAVGALLDSGDTRPSADDLANIAGMSRSAFQRRFLDIVGMTVAEFDVRLRIHRAALLLVET
ncbi:MAG: AraC family transcriptional regulator, partial [Alphaproteobacteria bacterium]